MTRKEAARMRESRELDALLQEAAAYQTKELQLNTLLKGIVAEGERREARGERAADAPLPMRRGRRVSLYAGAAAAAVFALAMLLPGLRSKQVVVEGKPYLAVGNTVQIDGEPYYLQESQAQQGAAVLHNIPGTNQYVQLQEALGELQIMVFPPDTPPQPERKNRPALPEAQVTTQEAAPVYPTIPGLVVRGGPGMDFAELGVLYTGQIVQKVGMHGNWAILEWTGGFAYAYDDYLFEAPEEIVSYSPLPRYATEPLNVRALPGSRDESEILAELDTGEEVLVTGVIGGWSQIDWQGRPAYVFSRYLRAQ